MLAKLGPRPGTPVARSSAPARRIVTLAETRPAGLREGPDGPE